MRILLIASIYGRKQYLDHYKKIVKLARDAGHEVQADHIIDISHEEMASWDDEKALAHHKWVEDQIKKADAIFAEVSHSSTGVGFLVAQAMDQYKPVVVFFSGEEEPHMLRNLEKFSDRLTAARYKKIEDLEKIVPQMLDFVSQSQDTRFNFFIGPVHVSYLNWISKNRRIPRSVYLRKLIDEHMKQHPK